MSELRDELAEVIGNHGGVHAQQKLVDAVLPIIERETERARAESEVKARRFANLLGNNAKALNDTLPREVLRQKAEAWDEGHHAGHEDARAVQPTYPDPTPNPYRTSTPTERTDDDHDF